MNRNHFVAFEIAPKYCTLHTFFDYEGYSISYKGFLPIVVDIMVLWIKFTRSSLFSSLIPKMLMFTLAISCLTTSSLHWFMDLTFQLSMQYYSFQYQNLLPSPVTSTIGHCFQFCSATSFFLELFLHPSPVAYWALSDLGSSSFSVISSCLFLKIVHEILKAKILKWFAIPFSSEPRFVRTLPYDPSIMRGTTWHAHSLTELDRVVIQVISLVTFL